MYLSTHLYVCSFFLSNHLFLAGLWSFSAHYQSVFAKKSHSSFPFHTLKIQANTRFDVGFAKEASHRLICAAGFSRIAMSAAGLHVGFMRESIHMVIITAKTRVSLEDFTRGWSAVDQSYPAEAAAAA